MIAYESEGLSPTSVLRNCVNCESASGCRGSQEIWRRMEPYGCGYIYYWFDRPQAHLVVVVVAAADRLVPMVTEATHVNKRIMRLRISHTTSVMSLVSVYAPTECCEDSPYK